MTEAEKEKPASHKELRAIVASSISIAVMSVVRLTQL